MPGFEVTVETRGGIFSRRMPEIVRRYGERVERNVAEYAEQEVHNQLHRVLRHPTGYYESHIRLEPSKGGHWEVNDGGMIYGPWLEGTGSRNSPVTRFPGYFTFRIVSERVNERAPGIAERVFVERTRAELED